MITVSIDHQTVWVPEGITVAAALVYSQDEHCRTSVSQQPRTPFCGMGICQECRLLINGQQRLACQTVCQIHMQIIRI